MPNVEWTELWWTPLLVGYVACVSYVHLRGKERFRFARQLTEHSGLFSPYNIWMYLFSAVPRRPFLPVETFPQMAPLKASWETIRDEARALYEGGGITASERHDDLAFVAFYRRGWKRFYLKWYGDILPSARAACPRTVALVESIEGINAAAFTLLPAGKKLGRHRDPFAGSLRYHLGLVTPNSDACRIWVDGQAHTWRDGEDVVFDETFIHWAENTSDVDRIILFCDVRRPLHTPVLRAFARFMDRRVFRITGSRNVPSERVGALNRITPVVFRIKTALTDAKHRNRAAYYATKHVLIAGLVYLLLVRPLLDG